MTTLLAPVPMFRGWDNNGNPLANGQLWSFAAGTSSPQATYTDYTQGTPNTNPVILNARGECSLWLDQTLTYKFVLRDAFGNLIWTVDNVAGTLNPQSSIIPATDNLYTLGSPSSSWANAYLGPQHAPVLDPASGNIGYYARTAAEISASVTPVDFSYAPGDFRRYGADPTGVAPSDTAIQQCVNCNADCFDGYPGGGTYLLTTGIVLTKYPVTIRGQARWTLGLNGAPLSGTQFLLNSTTVQAAHFSWNVPVYGLAIRDIGFSFATAGNQQRAILAQNDLHYAVIERCTFDGQASLAPGTGTTNIGIQLLNTAPNQGPNHFHGAVTIRDNLFDYLAQAIVLGYFATTVKITNNEFYGYGTAGGAVQAFSLSGGTGANPGIGNNLTPSGGHGTGFICQAVVTGGVVTAVTMVYGGSGYQVNDVLNLGGSGIGGSSTITVTQIGAPSYFGIGIQCVNPATEPAIIGNYFEGFTTAIYSHDSGYLKQIGNDYGPNVNHWFWAKVAQSRMWNTSIGETFVAAGSIGGYKTVGDFNTVLSQPSTLGDAWFDNASFTISGGLKSPGGLGVNGNTPAAQSTGWGSPVGAAVINNYNITDAGGANSNTNKALAQLIATLKATGILGA